MSNVTQTGAVGEVIVTQTGQEAAVTVVTARGPDASVTNANVNAAIDDDPAATRAALELGSAALADTGTGASNVILGNDARLTDARTPTAHASSHVTGGTDKIRDASAAQDGLMTTAFASKLNGIEAGADVTDAANVAAAGAVMESDYTPSHSILVQQSGTGSPSSLSVGNNTLIGRLSGGGSAIDDLSASQVRTLLNVEDGADVTDAANVASTIHAATSKTTPVDADEIPITDSAASFGLKKLTFANLKATLNTLYVALTGNQTIAGNKTFSGDAVFTSTTRPTSSGTGDPAATSLINKDDSTNLFALTHIVSAYRWSQAVGDYTSAHTGTGAASTATQVLQLNSLATAGSVALLRGDANEFRAWQKNSTTRQAPLWDLRTIYHARISTDNLSGADTVARLYLGVTTAANTATDLTSSNKAIGFKIIAGEIFVQLADGTTLTTTTTGVTVSAFAIYDLIFDSKGDGTWDAYVNSTKISGTGAPATAGSAGNAAMILSVTNGTTAAARRFFIHQQTTTQI